MEKIKNILIISVLPVLFLLFTLFCKTSKGDLFLSNYYDPSYVYLINSLNLSQFCGYGFGHIDHPGTTVQELGAAVILIVHSVSSGDDIVTDVLLKQPEFYLSGINFFSA